MAPRMTTVFLSYSSEDSTPAAALETLLVEAGCNVRRDRSRLEGIPPGREWAPWIATSIRNADGMLFLAGRSAAQSPYCLAELIIALAEDKPVLALCRQHGDALPEFIQPTQAQTIGLTESEWRDAVRELVERGFSQQRRRRGLLSVRRRRYDPARPPFPGLVPFAAEDNAVFFGRDGAVEDLHRMVYGVAGGDVIVVHGPSGAGKSSLARAGLLPVLASEGWATGIVSGDELSADFEPPEPGACGTLLLIDQAEAALRQPESADAVAAIVRSCGERGAICVLAMRSEYRAELDQSLAAASVRWAESNPLDPPAAQPNLLDFYLPYLDARNIAEVIRGPAAVANVHIASSVVDRLVAESASGTVLPLLAYALKRMWEDVGPQGRISESTLSVESVIDEQATQAMKDAVGSNGDGQRRVLETLARLADPSESPPVRRPVPLATFSEEERRWIDAFVRAGLLVRRQRQDFDLAGATAAPDGTTVVDVAHERLFTAWEVLAATINAQQQRLLHRQAVDAAFDVWQRNGHSPELLLGEPLLTFAEADTRAEEGAAPLKAFLRESRRSAARRRRTRRLAAGGVLSAALLLVAVLYGRADLQQESRLRATADALRKAAAAEAAIGVRRDDALTTAVEAVRERSEPRTIDALLDALLTPAGPLRYFRSEAVWSTVVALSTSEAAVIGGGGRVQIVDLTTGTLVEVNALSAISVSLLAGFDGQLAFAGRTSGGAVVGLYDRVADSVDLRTVSDTPTALTLGASTMAWGFEDGAVVALPLETPSPLSGREQVVATLSTRPLSLALSSGEFWLAMSAQDELWAAEQTQAGWLAASQLSAGPDAPTEFLAFRPGTNDLYGAGSSPQIWRRTLRSGEAPDRLEVVSSGHAAIAGLGFDENGSSMFAAQRDAKLAVIDPATGAARFQPLSGHRFEIRHLAVVPGGRVLSADGQLAILWDLEPVRRLETPQPALPREPVAAIVTTERGPVVAAGQDVMLATPNGSWASLFSHSEQVLALWGADSERLVFQDSSGGLWVLSDLGGDGPHDATPIADGAGAVAVVDCTIAYALDAVITVASVPGCGKASNTRTVTTDGAVSSLAMRPDGSAIAVGLTDGRTIVYSGDLVEERMGPQLLVQVTGLVWAGVDQLFVAGDRGDTLTFWDVEEGPSSSLEGHDDLVDHLLYLPELRLLLSGGEDGSVHLWDVDTRSRLGPGFNAAVRSKENDPTVRVHGLAYNAVDKRLLVARGGGIEAWDLDPESWQAHACRDAGVVSC